MLGPAYWSKADNACILPLGTLAFWTDKNTFGKDEVQDVINTQGGKWEKAFWLVVEGFSKDSFGALAVSVPVPTGSFANIPGVTVSQNPDIDFENGANPGAQQRIRVAFDITFTSSALSHFPASGGQTSSWTPSSPPITARPAGPTPQACSSWSPAPTLISPISTRPRTTCSI